MRDLAKMFGNEPDRFVRAHPIQSIKPGEVYRARTAAQRPLEPQVEVDVEVAHRELTQRAIDRLAITTTGKIGFRNRAPMSTDFENCDDVVSILIGLQIEDERWKAKDPERGCGKNSAFQTRRRAIT